MQSSESSDAGLCNDCGKDLGNAWAYCEHCEGGLCLDCGKSGKLIGCRYETGLPLCKLCFELLYKSRPVYCETPKCDCKNVKPKK